MSDLNTLDYSRRWTSAADFPSLAYTKDWNSSDDFPTVETDEAQVRADLQFHPDQIRDWCNGALRQYLAGIGAAGSLRKATNPATMVTVHIGTDWDADPTGGWAQTVTLSGVTVTGNSRLDLRGGAALRSSLAAQGVAALWIENVSGTLTARCIGGFPSSALEVPAELFETQPLTGVYTGTVYGDAIGGGGGAASAANAAGAAGTGSSNAISLPVAGRIPWAGCGLWQRPAP